MNFTTQFKSVPTDPHTRSANMGIEVSRSGGAVLDEYFYTDSNFPAKKNPEMAKFLVAAVSGTIVFQYFDGEFGFIDNAIAGFWYPIMAIRVMETHDFNNGGTKNTTAGGIGWYGGW